MGRIVVVAEKPSVGRDIASVLGCRMKGEGCLMNDRYTVTWAVGHLVTLCEPDEIDEKYKRWTTATLPILPDRIPLKVIRSSKDQYKIVSNLINDKDTDSLICATDAGREGELIFRYIYEKSRCRKPFDRLWINSMTEEAIKEGFRTLRSGKDYDGLYRSAQCRSVADWLVGMNASRAFTLRYNVLLSVGRVQTPTLALLVKRRKEIENFVPEEYATLAADYGDFNGICFSPELKPDTHLPSKARAEEIAKQIKGKTATVISAETTRGKENPPQLYDLNSLQRDANSKLGFTAKKTLDVAQSLYEKHKALTYPRTDSRYLPPDMIPKVVQTMKLLPDGYKPYVSMALPEGKLHTTSRTIDAAKVTDHHAIIPTTQRAHLDKMSEDERRLFDLVARRMLQAFSPACEFDATKIIMNCEEHTFRSTGRVILRSGWKEIPELEQPRKKKTTKQEEAEQNLPPLKRGDTRVIQGTKIKEDKTKPPSPHTDASLLSSMENAGRESDDEEIQRQMKGSGIGTPATRAAIIERLIQVGYAQRKAKQILATDKGVQLIGIMPQEIASAETTGRWELALEKIAHGEQDAEAFLESIKRFSAFLTQYAAENQAIASFPEEETRRRNGKKGITKKKLKELQCPLCGGNVTESTLAYGCDQPNCHFTLWKDCLVKGGGPELSEKLLRMLLSQKELKGSTGTIALTASQITFTRNGLQAPNIVRDLIYQKNQKRA